MKDNVQYLPIWKQNATAEERLSELAMIARQQPERFAKLVVVYVEEAPENRTVTRYITSGCDTIQALGILELGRYHLLQHTHGDGR